MLAIAGLKTRMQWGFAVDGRSEDCGFHNIIYEKCCEYRRMRRLLGTYCCQSVDSVRLLTSLSAPSCTQIHAIYAAILASSIYFGAAARLCSRPHLYSPLSCKHFSHTQTTSTLQSSPDSLPASNSTRRIPCLLRCTQPWIPERPRFAYRYRDCC
jgi:hypothetical protein